MKGFIPKRPTGDTPEARFMQFMWDKNCGPESHFNDSDTVKWDYTTKGRTAHAKTSSTSKAGTTLTLFRVQSETFDTLTCKAVSVNSDGIFSESATTTPVFKPDGLINAPGVVTYFGMQIQYTPLQLSVGTPAVLTTSPNKRFSRWINGDAASVKAGLNAAYKEVVWPPYLDTNSIVLGPSINNLIWAFKRWDGKYTDANLTEGGTGQVREWMREVVTCVVNGSNQLALVKSTHVYNNQISFSTL